MSIVKKIGIIVGCLLLAGLVGVFIWKTVEADPETLSNDLDPAVMIALLQEELVDLEKDLEGALNEEDRAGIRAQRTAMEAEIEALRGGLPEEYQNIWHPSRIIEDYEEIYRIWGYSSEYEGEKIYHLILESNGAEKNPLEGEVTATLPNRWRGKCIDEKLKIYVQLSESGIPGIYGSDLILEPYQILKDKPYGENTAESLDLRLHTEAVQRFVFQYNPVAKTWDLHFSTNKVAANLTVTANVTLDGVSQQETTQSLNNWLFDDFYQSEEYAVRNGSIEVLSRNTTAFYLESALLGTACLEIPITAAENLHQLNY